MRVMKLPPYRKTSRKIGRNEPCPCGKIKWRKVPVKNVYTTEDGKRIPIMDEVGVPVKYKHCCGDIIRQRAAVRMQHNIKMAVKWMVAKKLENNKKGFIKKLKRFFGRGE